MNPIAARHVKSRTSGVSRRVGIALVFLVVQGVRLLAVAS